MISKIVMPPGGQTTETSLVSSWLVSIGDAVKRGDILLEVETDKATLAVESFANGVVIDILVPAGTEASEGDVLALVGSEQDRAAYQKETAPRPAAMPEEDEYQPILKARPEPAAAATNETAVPSRPGAYPAMPGAKKEARERGVDLSRVVPATGGVIKRADVTGFADSAAAAAQGGESELIPLSRMRKAIAARMLESVSTVPAFQETVLVDMRAAMALREQLKKKTNVSYNDIIARCVCAAVKDHRLINASYTDEGIRVHRQVNVGLAVSVDGGLLVPVVKNAQAMSLGQIARQSAAQIAKARDGALPPDDMAGGTITLSNLGMYAIEQFTAIINPPESCILAIGRIHERPVFEAGAWQAVPFAAITATFDHRVIDGAYGAAFLTDLKAVLENPSLAL